MRDEDVDLLVLKLRRRWPFPDLTTLKLAIVTGRHSCPVWLDPPVARDRSQPKNRLLTADQLLAARLLSSRQDI